jgi:cystathionine beta-lyase
MPSWADALVEWQAQQHGWAIDPAGVHSVGDVMHGVDLAIRYFSGPDDPVIIPTPVYMPFFDIVRLTGRPQVHVPMSWDGARWTFDLAAIDAAFAAGGRTVLISSPHNPLGRVFDAAELAGLAAVVARHGGRVISDEIHAPLVFDRPHLPYAAASPEAADHSITVLSASKAWNLPGLKCAPRSSRRTPPTPPRGRQCPTGRRSGSRPWGWRRASRHTERAASGSPRWWQR